MRNLLDGRRGLTLGGGVELAGHFGDEGGPAGLVACSDAGATIETATTIINYRYT